MTRSPAEREEDVLGALARRRTGSVADVAAAIECSPSTAGANLRKGEAALVDACLDG
jgi:hypothetical protein